MNKLKRFLCLLTVLVFSGNFIFAADTTSSTKYDDINFPQWAKDLRRTEIITFGSLPFVTLWTSTAYGLAVQGSFHNPLDKSSSSYTESQQKQIMVIAAATSLGLGLTDLIINLITRNIKISKQKKAEKTIRVIPFSEQQHDNNDNKINIYEQEHEEDLPPPDIQIEKIEKIYLIEGLEGAVF